MTIDGVILLAKGANVYRTTVAVRAYLALLSSHLYASELRAGARHRRKRGALNIRDDISMLVSIRAESLAEQCDW